MYIWNERNNNEPIQQHINWKIRYESQEKVLEKKSVTINIKYDTILHLQPDYKYTM